MKEISLLKNFANFIGKHLRWSLFFFSDGSYLSIKIHILKGIVNLERPAQVARTLLVDWSCPQTCCIKNSVHCALSYLQNKTIQKIFFKGCLPNFTWSILEYFLLYNNQISWKYQLVSTFWLDLYWKRNAENVTFRKICLTQFPSFHDVAKRPNTL